MSKIRRAGAENYSIEGMLNDLSDQQRLPNWIFVLLLALYFACNIFVSILARSEGVMQIFGRAVPFDNLPGVFSSLSNACLILLVIFYRKPGFITAMILIMTNLPFLIFTFFVRGNVTAFAGISNGLFTAIASIVIYATGRNSLKYQQRMHTQAMTDILTDLPNKFACTELMSGLIKKEQRFAILSVDIGNFKGINDTMGHEFGDKVLKTLADRWKEFADNNLTETTDFVGRLGGDEFAVIIRGYKTEEDVLQTIKVYKSALEQRLEIDESDYYMSAFYGYAMYPEDGADSDSMLSFANAAMHEAQRRGLTAPLKFTPDILKDEHLIETERKIRTALDTDNVFPYFQPQYDITHQLRGFEALARMKDSEGNFISPGEFIPVAEKVGLVDKIDSTVFAKAASLVSDVLRQKDSNFTVSVNISVKHLMKNNFIDETRAIIDKYNIPTSNIEIEITESVMIESAEKALERINTLKDMGFKIAIDDFGTGYSSLSYLNNIPSDLLKIDKSFIDVMNDSESSQQYVAMIVAIGHVMKLDVISEGVESQDQIETLRDIGCDYIQGFVWGRPLPYEQALEIALEG